MDSTPPSRMARLAASLTFLLYPVIVGLGLHYAAPEKVGAALFVVIITRLFFFRGAGRREILLLSALAVLVITAMIYGSEVCLLLYPVLVNAALLAAFSYSLFFPPTAVERIASLRHGALPSEAITYCRGVTKIWCAFFVLNGSISLASVASNSRVFWVIYNGFVSYLLIGALFLGEYIVRRTRMSALEGGSVQ